MTEIDDICVEVNDLVKRLQLLTSELCDKLDRLRRRDAYLRQCSNGEDP